MQHAHSPMVPVKAPQQKCTQIHVDLVGLLPQTKKGFIHILMAVDRSTWWAEALLLVSTTAECYAVALTDS
jgi:hypothetical protein